MFFFTLYSLGLRLGEGLALTVGDIDAQRMRVHVRDAYGNRDRLVPLPEQTLQVLRRWWPVHKNPRLLFPNRAGGLRGARTATSALDRGGVQRALRQVAAGCGLKKNSPPQSSPQLCNTPDRGRCRPAGGAEDSGPPQHSDHQPLHPPHQPHQAQLQRTHQ